MTAKPDGFTDSNWAMEGTFTVFNPNQYKTVEVGIDDVPNTGPGVACTLDTGQNLSVVAGATQYYGYACTFDGKPDYDGTNTAGLTWTGPDGEHEVSSNAAPVKFELAGETNRTAKVFDDKVTDPDDPELLGTVDWADGDQRFDYPLPQAGVAGVCTDYTNTASLEPQGGPVGGNLGGGLVRQQDSTTVTVCVQDDLKIAKNADASFDRAYDWLIDKEVDKTKVTVDGGRKAAFAYTVTATPGDYTDSNWSMTGTIDVTNPNAYADGAITAAVVDVPGVGEDADCAVIDGAAVTIAPGSTKTLDYTCTFGAKPAYAGRNETTAAWTGPAGDARTASGGTDVVFDLNAEANKTVVVVDDLTDPDAVPVELGEATWTQDRAPKSYRYTIEKEAVAGVCADYSNIATIAEIVPSDELVTGVGSVLLGETTTISEGGPSASVEVTACGRTVLAPRVAPPDALLPNTGAPARTAALLGLGFGGLVIGGWLLAIGPRRNRLVTRGGPRLKS